jgi:multiple sugar transport system substrate-binding protein
MPHITRRVTLGAAIASLAAPSIGLAQNGAPLTLLTHPVLKSVAVSTIAGDITSEWRQRTGTSINWVTLETNPLHERLFREAALPRTSIDLAFIVNALAVPRVATLFEPLDGYLKTSPIADLPDVFPGLLKGMTIDGRLYGIPFRHSTSGLHYNETFFAERQIAAPPRSIEEFAEWSRELTYTRDDGGQVYGFVTSGQGYPNVVDLARAWNGDFITPDFRVVANEPPMVQAITLLRDFYKAGVLPKGFAQIKDEDVNTWMAGGRGAMTINSFSRTQFYNDPNKSRFPGAFHAVPMPAAATLHDRFPAAPVKTEFWSLVIPKNSQRKDEAWSLIVDMLSPKSTVTAALNGNGPVRASTYRDPQVIAKLPYAEAEATALKYARIPLPAFDQSARAADIFVEEMQLAVLGSKEPQAAMDDVVKRVTPLVKAAG